MAENRVKVIIEADPKGAISSLGDFRKALDLSGASAKLTDNELAKLADRFLDKLSADKATAALDRTRQQIERIGTAAGLSQGELSRLSRQIGAMPSGGGGLSGMLSGLTGGNTAEIAATSSALETLALKLGTVVAAYVSLKAVGGFFAESLMSAARYETLGVVLEKVGENAGYTRKEMLAYAEGVQQTGISMLDARESVAKMATAELDLSKATSLARVAQGAAVVTGQNSSEVFAKLVQGITTGQTILLHHQGIMVSLEDAYKSYAKQLGLTKDLLTETDKRQAALNAVLDYGSRYAGSYEAAMGTAGKQITSFQRYISDLKTTLGEADLGAFTDVVFDAANSIKHLQETINDPEVQEVLAQMGEGLAALFRSVIEGATNATKEFAEAIKAIETSWEGLDPELKTFVKYGMSIGAGAIVGARVGGFWGGVAGAGIGAWQASGSPSFFDNWRLSEMQKEVDRRKSALDAESDPEKRQQLEQDYNAQLEFMKNFEEKKISILDQYNAESKKLNKNNVDTATIPVADGISAQDQKDALNKWWAEYNKGVKEYNEKVKVADQVGVKNQSHAPLEVQTAAATKTRDAELAAIGRGWMAAYDAGNWDKVRQLNDAASASLGAYNDKLDQLDKKANRGAKSAEAAAIAADRYEASSQSFYDQTVASLTQMADSLTGGSEKNLNRVDKWFEQHFNSIRQKVIGAKGDVSAYAAIWVKLEEAAPGMKLLATTKDTCEQLKKQASLLQDIASATGSPSMAAKASDLSAKSWYDEKKTTIDTTYPDEAQKTTMLAALQDAYNAKLRAGRAAAYESTKAVSEAYWSAERARITASLETVKKEATDETAYRIYAAEQWDGYYKKLLENQAAYTGTFGATLAAKFDLAFGGYKSAATKSRDYWGNTADSVVTLTNGMVSSVSGAFGELTSKILKGTATATDFWDAMCDKMISAFSAFVEEIINNQLKQLLSYINVSGLGSLFGLGSGGIASTDGSIESLTSSSSLASVAEGYSHGGAFEDAPGLETYVNTIVDRPTYFPLALARTHAFANGAGLMGEAGAEAIMPITHRSGRLGVDASGIGGNTIVNIHNYSGQDATSKQSTDSNGTQTVDIMIGDMVAKQIGTYGSSANKAIATTFGARPAVIGR